MPTLGDTNIGATPNGIAANSKAASKWTLSQTGVFQSMTIYVNGGSSDGTIRCGIYADSAAAPGALRGSTVSSVVVTSQAAAFVTMNFATPFTLTAADYYLAVQADSSQPTFRFNSTLHRWQSTDSFADGLADPWGASDIADFDGISWPMYATYTLPAGLNTTLDQQMPVPLLAFGSIL